LLITFAAPAGSAKGMSKRGIATSLAHRQQAGLQRKVTNFDPCS
jgi:hypothetical protein